MSFDRTISERLAEIGIRHERDANSSATGQHKLYRGEQFLGSYSAAEAARALNFADAFKEVFDGDPSS